MKTTSSSAVRRPSLLRAVTPTSSGRESASLHVCTELTSGSEYYSHPCLQTLWQSRPGHPGEQPCCHWTFTRKTPGIQHVSMFDICLYSTCVYVQTGAAVPLRSSV
jgi:hypothetical protein